MKKKFTILISAALMLLTMVAQPVTAWGQNRVDEVAYTLDGTITGGTTGYATESEITQNNITWMVTGNTTMNPWRIGGKNLSNENRPLYSTSPLSDDIVKVVVTNGTATATVNSMTLIVSPNADFSEPTSTISGTWAVSSTTMFERPAGADWSGKYFKLVYNITTSGSSNQFAQFVKAELYKEKDASAPDIEAQDVEIAYDATSGVIAYTIDNPVSDGALTATTDSDWLTLGSVGTTVPFTCTANSTAIARTATVTLTYTYNTDQTVTKSITVTQLGNPNAVDNISDITATGTYSVQGTIVAKSTRGFIVGDGTGYVYYYNTNYTPGNYNIGDKVRLSGSVVVYGGVFEFNSSTTITAVTESNYQFEEPTVLSGSDMDARVASTTPPQLSSYIQYIGVLSVSDTHYNITDIDGAQTAIGSISYPLDTEFTSLDGKQVKVTGYYVGISTGTYYNTMLGSIEEVIGGDPYITANDVEITYNSDGDEIEYEIINPVSGGVTDASTTSDWLTLDEPNGGVLAFSCPVNTSAATRTATVTLTYTYNTDQTVTKDVTVTQTGNPNATMTIAEVRAQGTGSVITSGIVTSCVGTTGYIQDATAAICVYGSELTVGDEIKVSGTLSTYKGLLEITNPEVTVLSQNNTVNPTVMTIEAINSDDYTASTSIQGWYVTIEAATVTAISGSNTTIAQGSNSIAVRGITGVEYAVNDILTLDGNIGCYNGAQIANPQNVQVQSAPAVPSITVTPTTINAPAEGADGSLAVTYENIPDLIAFDIMFCDANGDELQGDDPEWIYAEITEPTGDEGYVVSYIIEANDGEARNAYFKVYTFVGNDLETVNSNLVTVNQAKYVVNYATLPFEFDGGRADIANTNGLTQEGLDSDYSSSPKLKFNSAGDYVLLHFTEEPGTLSFDIKGNSFSGGTFKVQTSEDGETYTDLETYTELGAVQSESFANLGANVRYIKWIYTVKDGGNVALGNIHLYEVGGGPTPVTYDLTVDPFENLEIFVFVGGDETNPVLDSAGTIQVTEGDQVMLSVEAVDGYELQSLMVDGVEHVNDITEATYTFNMPSHNVTVNASAVSGVPPTPFEPVTYTLATSIESGKSYIIVGSKAIDEVTSYYAMGEQKDNNRGAYAISMNGNTATVETEDVHEVVITALEGDFYSIFDGGYLYAAGSNKNYLKTQDSLDVNGQWEISIDESGQFSIVASNSSNRNVMQFNYNSGNPLFSCYGSASQSPVYLYVKDETPTTYTQTIDLVGGEWNWISTYIDMSAVDGFTILKAALGDDATTINSFDDAAVFFDPDWIGMDGYTMSNADMLMIEAENNCTITLEGPLVDPSTVTVTILPQEWTWIGCPYADVTDLSIALDGFTPEFGDIIGDFSGSTMYWGDADGWIGDFDALTPGQGYMYYSESDVAKTLTFHASKKACKAFRVFGKNKLVLRTIDIDQPIKK